MKRIFIFSYHGSDTFQTSFNRLKSFAEILAAEYEVYFVHGQLKECTPLSDSNYREIVIPYSKGFIRNIYTSLLKREAYSLARIVLLTYYFLARREILDLHHEFFTYLKKSDIRFTPQDVVIASYPSWAIHKLGVKLKKRYGCKLILDFRDPGVFGYQHVADNAFIFFLRKFFMQRSEIRNLEIADKCIAATESIKNCFKEEYRHKFEVIRNGAAINLLDPVRIKELPAKFKIIYIGQLYDDQLDNLNFFEGVKDFIVKHSVMPQELEIKFFGGGAIHILETVVAKFGLGDFVTISKRIPLPEVYNECFSASLFLQLKYGERDKIVASKQYDYVALQKPILLPASDNGDIEDFIKTYDAGYVCNSATETEQVIEQLYLKWKSGHSLYMAKPEDEIFKISRAFQGEKLRSIVKSLA